MVGEEEGGAQRVIVYVARVDQDIAVFDLTEMQPHDVRVEGVPEEKVVAVYSWIKNHLDSGMFLPFEDGVLLQQRRVPEYLGYWPAVAEEADLLEDIQVDSEYAQRFPWNCPKCKFLKQDCICD